jgi:hypothetical protein
VYSASSEPLESIVRFRSAPAVCKASVSLVVTFFGGPTTGPMAILGEPANSPPAPCMMLPILDPPPQPARAGMTASRKAMAAKKLWVHSSLFCLAPNHSLPRQPHKIRPLLGCARRRCFNHSLFLTGPEVFSCPVKVAPIPSLLNGPCGRPVTSLRWPSADRPMVNSNQVSTMAEIWRP